MYLFKCVILLFWADNVKKYMCLLHNNQKPWQSINTFSKRLSLSCKRVEKKGKEQRIKRKTMDQWIKSFFRTTVLYYISLLQYRYKLIVLFKTEKQSNNISFFNTLKYYNLFISTCRPWLTMDTTNLEYLIGLNKQ